MCFPDGTLREKHNADVVQNVHLSLTDLIVSARVVYVPLYIDERSLFGRPFNIFVSGTDAAVHAPRQFSALKMAAALYLPILLSADALTPVDYIPPAYYIGALLAAVLAGRLGSLGPMIYAFLSVRLPYYRWFGPDHSILFFLCLPPGPKI